LQRTRYQVTRFNGFALDGALEEDDMEKSQAREAELVRRFVAGEYLSKKDTAEARKLAIVTRDIGLAIRDFIEGQSFHRFDDDVELPGLHEMIVVDCSDPDNLEVHCENGQRFIVRIIAA
jgi:hypothetical protein